MDVILLHISRFSKLLLFAFLMLLALSFTKYAVAQTDTGIVYDGLQNEYDYSETVAFKIKCHVTSYLKINALYYFDSLKEWRTVWHDTRYDYFYIHRHQILKKGEFLNFEWKPSKIKKATLPLELSDGKKHKLPTGRYKFYFDLGNDERHEHARGYSHEFILK